MVQPTIDIGTLENHPAKQLQNCKRHCPDCLPGLPNSAQPPHNGTRRKGILLKVILPVETWIVDRDRELLLLLVLELGGVTPFAADKADAETG